LRYVKYGDEVRASDVLAKLECLRALRDALKAKATEMGCPGERIDPLVDRLDSIIAMIRYVRSGDIIQPEDHNYVVDALRKARDVLAEIESFCNTIKAQLDACVAELGECRAELAGTVGAVPQYEMVMVFSQAEATLPETAVGFEFVMVFSQAEAILPEAVLESVSISPASS
jgi:hypothetical protein